MGNELPLHLPANRSRRFEMYIVRYFYLIMNRNCFAMTTESFEHILFIF